MKTIGNIKARLCKRTEKAIIKLYKPSKKLDH